MHWWNKFTRFPASLAPDRFSILREQADFLSGGLTVGSAGCCAASPNIFPKITTRIYDLYTCGKTREPLRLHQMAAQAEDLCKAGIATMKYAVTIFSASAAGLENTEDMLQPRRPYKAPSEDAKKAIREAMAP